MKLKHFLVIVLLVQPMVSHSQYLFLPDTTITVSVNGNVLRNGFAGGFNFPVFSEIDLDGDGIMDLFAIDRVGNNVTRISTFINKGTPDSVDYHYAPYYRKFFPEMKDFAVLVDYNCDGKADIFTYAPGGMAVYRNDFDAGTGLKFTKVVDLLHSTYYSPPPVNLWVSPVNLPAFADIDNDGDLDILTFGLGGFQVEYHKNQSMELYGHCDSLIFQLATACWGQFTLSAFSNSAVLGVSCPFKPAHIPQEKQARGAHLHGGSAILALDLDNDTVKDMIMGDLLGNNLLALFNGGDLNVAEMIAQDTLYPPQHPVNIPTYPVPMYFDVNNDGIKDLIVAPSYLNNYDGIWYYKNNGTNSQPDFNFLQSAFLQDQMIDLGEGSFPVFFDYDGDGLPDIISGNYGYFNPSASYPSSLHLYKNVGTSTDPAFEHVTDDFSGLLLLGLSGIHPTFGDLDGDGDLDMIIGDWDGYLHYFTNTAGPGNVANFVLTQPNLGNFDVGQFSAPQLYDVNKNGKLDLLVGKRNGMISYFENTGTTSSPAFTKITDTLGGIDVRTIFSVTGHSVPFMYSHNNTTKLLVGTERGTLFLYDNIDGNLSGTFNLVDSTYHNIHEGNRISPHGADINGDGKMDLIVGNHAGGFTIYLQSNISSVEEIAGNSQFTLYPNPAENIINISFTTPLKKSTELSIINNLGQTVKFSKINAQHSQIDCSGLSVGLYFVKIRSENEHFIQKLIISR